MPSFSVPGFLQKVPLIARQRLTPSCVRCRLMLLAPGVLIASDNLLTPSELLHLGLVCYPAQPSVQRDKPQWPLELDVLGCGCCYPRR